MASFLSNENHDNSKRTDYAKQIPLRLFQNWNPKQSDIIAKVGGDISRDEQWACHFSFPSYSSELFVTSPTATKISPVPPNAPIKPRKFFFKVGLKPKRLRFTDKEKDEAVNKNHHQKNVNFSIEAFDQRAEFSKRQRESNGPNISRENLAVVLQNVRLETDNKENRQYREEQYKMKIKDNYHGVKKHAKCNNNSSQSSKVNSIAKGEFVHFRI